MREEGRNGGEGEAVGEVRNGEVEVEQKKKKKIPVAVI